MESVNDQRRGQDEARTPLTIYEQAALLEKTGVSFVLVTLVEALGSTPQDTGAKMIVTEEGLLSGTVGGGRVEAAALKVADELLRARDPKAKFVSWTLKGDVGMTCGGSVKLYFEPNLETGPWHIAVFGAGHVAQALIPVLIPLDAKITCIDSRAEWLDRLPKARNLSIIHSTDSAPLVSGLPKDSFLVVMTMGHASDRPILRAALSGGSFPFIGVIGSDAKAEVLRKELLEDGISQERVSSFHCPIGLDFGSNHPHEIALSVAAQLLTERDRLKRQS